MIGNITSLTNNGLRDWLVQRVSAVVLGAYTIFMFTFFYLHPKLDYKQWQHLFHSPWMRVVTLVFLLSLILHAWIGIWTVSTDYMKSLGVRITFQMLVILALMSFFIWGVAILWGA